MTKEEFINKARELHGDKYSYELVPDEFNANSKVKIVCPVHGEFEQCARTHYRKSGCPKCALDGRVKSMRSSNDEFIAKLKTVFGDKYGTDLVEYKDGDTKVKLVCDKHGVFEKTPHELLRGNGCPVCGSERGHANRRILFDNVIKRANTIHHNKYGYEKFIYNGFFTKSTIICPIHGEFEQSMSKHLLGQGCPLCGRESSADAQRKGTDEFIAESKKKFGDKFDYSKVVYVNNKANVLLKCDKHGWFEITPQSHLSSKTGCKLCGMEITKDVQTYPHCPIAQIGIGRVFYHLRYFIHMSSPITNCSCWIIMHLIHETAQIITSFFVIWNNIFPFRTYHIPLFINFC